MALIKQYKDIAPKWGKECYFSENATLVGDVTLGDECSIWFNAVVRGDVARVTLGNRCNVQDGSCLHVTNFGGAKRPTEDFVNGHDLLLEDDVTVGHNATLHACHVKRGALIGMGATILDNAVIGEGAVIAAGALVLGGTQVGDHELWAGVPAKMIFPPPAPPSSPISIMWSATLIMSRLCSMTMTVFPFSTSLSMTESRMRISSKCKPVVGSSRM